MKTTKNSRTTRRDANSDRQSVSSPISLSTQSICLTTVNTNFVRNAITGCHHPIIIVINAKNAQVRMV